MSFMDTDEVIVIDSESDSGEECEDEESPFEEEEDMKPDIDHEESITEDTVNMADDEKKNIFMSNETIAENKKKLGNEHYKAQNYEAALKLYSDAISLCPDSAQYYGNRAACYMMTANYTLALADARHAVRLDPNFDKAYVRIAKCCLTLGDIVGADLAIKKSLELNPQNHSILYERNILNQLRDLDAKIKNEYEKRDYRSVVYYVDNVLKLAPACVRYRLIKGECLAFLGRYEEALDLAVGVMKVDATSAEAIYLRGLCLYFTDSLDKAIQHFQHTLQLDPDHAKAKEMRNKTKMLKELKEEGNLLYKNQRYTDAYRVYTQALQIDQLNTDINSKLYYNRALVSSKMNKLQEAVDDCTKVLAINNDYLKAILLRARCYSELEMYKECVADYEEAVKKHKSPEMKRLLRDAKFALKRSLRDYYKILGVSKNATNEEIKSNYKKKAMLHHPDRHTNSTAEQRKMEEVKFKEISEAYNVLIDPAKRQNYDSGNDFVENESFDSQMKRNFFFFTGGSGTDEYRYGY